ncbi:hypothetical protein [Sphingobacterium pedocola]|uniref:DUF1735 domain-containing protein n=1 Tax=Sphingobacterium pedocola TaxID=2082722 RepID=A0ABR9T3U8_9SPHI|nr:hypothetical protein [Sphingobacterium pedocola]MBE8719965.1 hypothetical protein [Sphingobacterium pedocola]
MNKIHTKTCIWMLLLLGFLSCTKTAHVDYEKPEFNKILAFSITNTEQELLGAINEEKNTITLYVPYYYAIEYLMPEIRLDEGASIYNSEGEEINLDGGLEPLRLGADTTKYTVKSATGASRSYAVIQKVLPYGQTLNVSISGTPDATTLLEKPVNGRLTLIGNFESTSTNARFVFTNKATGEQHNDYATAFSVSPGTLYTMLVDISPNAMAGEYDVKMEHQGRVTDLNPMKLYYRRPYMTQITSSMHYAAGDTIEFTISRNSPTDDRYGTVFVGLKNLYARVAGDPLTYNTLIPNTAIRYTPEGFPLELLNKNVPMKIVSATRTTVKAIFPDLPIGLYPNSGWNSQSPTIIYHTRPTYGLAFYGDFDEQTDLGNDVLINRGGSSGLTVKAKQ